MSISTRPLNPDKRPRRVALFLLFAVVTLTAGWVAVSKDEAPIAEDSPSTPPIAVDEPLALPKVLELLAAVTTPDAGLENPSVPDAGAQGFSIDAGNEKLLAAAILKRWKEALAPLFKRDSQKAGIQAPVISVQADTHADDVDAGAAPMCGENVEQFPLRAGALDIVVAIDTSGSMYEELSRVVAWLTTLELMLRRDEVDFQLLVVADHTTLARRNRGRRFDGGYSDAGNVQASIGSRDALETLIASAREGPGPRWPGLLRPYSTKHVVIITDDEARDESGQSYLAPLLVAAGGLLGSVEKPTFALHLIGGFEPPNSKRVMGPAAPLATSRCRGGVAPGLAYQRLAQTTKGLRASVCDIGSMYSLAVALAKWPVPSSTIPCMWLMRSGAVGDDIYEARAVSAKRSVRLSEGTSANSCFGRRDAFLTSGQVFALCGDTCASLGDAGFESVTISTRCRK